MLLAAGMTMTKARSKRASHSGWVGGCARQLEDQVPREHRLPLALANWQGLCSRKLIRRPTITWEPMLAIRFALYVSHHLVNLLALLLDGNRLWFLISIEWSIGTAGDYSACESSNTVRDLPACAVKP